MNDSQQPFKLNNIRIDPSKDQLSSEGNTLEIQSMAMKVLCYFAQNQDQLITRDMLRDDVWNNSTTSDHTINNHIYSLRRAIAQLDAETKYIHTVTGSNGKGYRLLATMSEIKLIEKVAIHQDEMVTIDGNNVKHQSNEQAPKRKSTKPLPRNKLSLLLLLFFLILAASYKLLFGDSKYDLVTPISFQEGREHNPAITTDGKTIVYAHRDKRKSKSSRWALYASHIDTPNKAQRLFEKSTNNDNYASISPNKRYITFLRSVSGEKGIYIADFNSEKLTAANPKAPLRIYLYDLALDSSEQITSPPINTFGDMAAVVSPDKKWLAIMRADGDYGYQLNILNLTTQKLVKTPVKTSENRLNISFSDDSEEVYFVDALGYLASYQIQSQHSKAISKRPFLGYWPLKIPGKAQFIMQQEWSLSSLTTQIVRFSNPIKGGNGTSEVVVNNGLSIRAIEGIDNNGLIFASVKPNHHIELWRFNQDKAEKLEAFNEKSDYRYPLSLHWLKHSDKALLSINKSCRLVNIKTGKDSPLCPAESNVYAGRFSHDGQSIYLASKKEASPTAAKMGLTGYPYENLPKLDNANLIVQASSEDFYYSETLSFDIYHYNTVTDKHTKLIDRTFVFNEYSINDFVLTNDGIYFMDRVKVANNAVYYYDFNSKKTQFVIPSKDYYPNIVVSENEAYIYLIESVDNDSKLLLIE